MKACQGRGQELKLLDIALAVALLAASEDLTFALLAAPRDLDFSRYNLLPFFLSSRPRSILSISTICFSL